MSLAIRLQTERSLILLAVHLPAYKPSRLIWLIAALLLAVAGLAADVALAPVVVGAVALPVVAAALGMVLGLLGFELWK